MKASQIRNSVPAFFSIVTIVFLGTASILHIVDLVTNKFLVNSIMITVVINVAAMGLFNIVLDKLERDELYAKLK